MAANVTWKMLRKIYHMKEGLVLSPMLSEK